MADTLGDLLEPAPDDLDTRDEDQEEPTEPEAPEADGTETDVDDVEVPEGAQNPDAVKRAIQAERKKARDAYAKARELERKLAEREEAEKPLEERISTATSRAEAAELKAMRLEVGLSKGLSLTLSNRLQGSSKEEMETDAESLLAEMGSAPKPGMDGGFKPAPVVPTDPNKAHNNFVTALLQNTRHAQ